MSMASIPKSKQMASLPILYKWAISAEQFGKWFKGYNDSKMSSPYFGNDSMKFRLHLEFDNQLNKDLVFLELVTTITDMPESGDEPVSQDILVHYKLNTYGNSFNSDKPVKLLLCKPQIVWKTDYVFPYANPNMDKMIRCELTVNKTDFLNVNSLNSTAEEAYEENNPNLDLGESMKGGANSPTPPFAEKNSSISKNDNFSLDEYCENEQQFNPLPVDQSEVNNEDVRSSTPLSINTLAEANKKSNQVDILVKQLTMIQSMSHLADVIFNVCAKQFKAHKIILAARSTVFEALFSSESEVDVSQIIINDIDPEVFQVLLNFIYTGDIFDIKKYVAELLVVANKYNIKCLISECVKHLDSSITVENACKILHFASQQNMPDVKTQTIAFIGDHIQEVIASYSYKEFVKPNAALLAELFESIHCPSFPGNLSLN